MTCGLTQQCFFYVLMLSRLRKTVSVFQRLHFASRIAILSSYIASAYSRQLVDPIFSLDLLTGHIINNIARFTQFRTEVWSSHNVCLLYQSNLIFLYSLDCKRRLSAYMERGLLIQNFLMLSFGNNLLLI